MVRVDPMLLLPLAPPLMLVWLMSRGSRPGGVCARLLRLWTLGVLAIFAWDLTPLPHLGLNTLSALAVGALGLPGLGLMSCLNLM